MPMVKNPGGVRMDVHPKGRAGDAINNAVAAVLDIFGKSPRKGAQREDIRRSP